jgi:protein-disulfide isomerase
MNEVTYTLKTLPKKTDHHKGPLEASVIIVEYGDFQCPFCSATAKVLDKIFKSYIDVCVIFRHFPLLATHANAAMAAVVFDSQDDLSTENILTLAKALGLSMRTFLNDLEDEELLKRVRQDMDYGMNNGVFTTPTLFVNGVRFEGLPTFEGLGQEIDQILTDNQTFI